MPSVCIYQASSRGKSILTGNKHSINVVLILGLGEKAFHQHVLGKYSYDLQDLGDLQSCPNRLSPQQEDSGRTNMHSHSSGGEIHTEELLM